MIRETSLLRVLLVMFLVGLVPASGLLYIVSLDLAAAYPELAHARLPIYVAVLVGLVPLIVAVKVVFDFLSVVDQGEAFSPPEPSGCWRGSSCSSGSLPPTSCSASWAYGSPPGSAWAR